MIDGLSDVLNRKLELLPARPGVYIFRDREGHALYVGKAKSLRSRVRSYFQAGSSDDRQLLPALVARIADLDTVVVDTEKEAAILENSLIKEKQPPFNIKLRDDKEYLTLRLDPNESWPRLTLVRVPAADRAEYFGPYHTATAARRTLHLVEKHFRLRTCSDREMESRTRPCLQYQIKRCDAPCVGLCEREQYQQLVRAVQLFLSDCHDELSTTLEQQMAHAAETLEYERAMAYRDQLRAVAALRQKQRVVSVGGLDQDVLGLYREGDMLELAVMVVRGGRMVDAYSLASPRTELDAGEIVAAFLREQYAAGRVPHEILVPVLPDGAEGIAQWLSERQAAEPGSRRRVRLLVPQRGPRSALLQLALDNAKHAFLEKQRAQGEREQRLKQLQEKLRLPELPRRIECTDISHLGGDDTVGSVVAMLDGQLDKARYRTYRVKSETRGDDYLAMYEVLRRRFRRGGEAREGEAWSLPDLFVVDGGRGQLAVAMAAARDLGLAQLQLAGLAKERETASGQTLVDRVYLPGQKNPIALREHSSALFLLAQLRDEAHRFANLGRSRAGTRRRLQSALDGIAGIGPKTRVALLRAFGSVANVLSATESELLAVSGVNRRHVGALEAFRREHMPDNPVGGYDTDVGDEEVWSSPQEPDDALDADGTEGASAEPSSSQ